MSYEPDLRASDADREAAVERLRAAALEGRLDADELEERLAQAYAARWCSELSRLTTDVTAPVVFVRAERRVNPYNPCLPYVDSRTCERHPAIESPYAPFDPAAPNYFVLN